jgi:hypothetical protein
MIDLDSDVEADAAARAFTTYSTAAPTGASGRRSPARSEWSRIDSVPLAEKEHPSIAGDVQVRDAAAKAKTSAMSRVRAIGPGRLEA